MSKEKQNIPQKRKDITGFFMIVAVFMLLNFVFSYTFVRFDWTTERRYTLSESTVKLLKNLDDVVYLKVYLQGDLSPSFARLRNETKEILDQFRAYSNNQVEYEFINPTENPNKEETDKIEKQIYEKGIIYELDVQRKKQKMSESRIWPGAIASYKGRETVWQIFNRQQGIEKEQCINNSVNELEYGFMNTVRKLQSKKKPEVTFIEGHGELDTLKLYDFMNSLGEYYNVNRVNIDEKIGALKGSDAIVIVQPDSIFSERDKFIIDQYIMKGGKVLWLMDQVNVNRDTLNIKNYSIGLNNNLNLEDMLFKYGVRLNPVLVQDLQCAPIALTVGSNRGTPNIKLFQWLYSPLVIPDGDHAIVKNLDGVKMDFVGNLDTITSARGIKKTILLRSSRDSKVQPTPARIFHSMVQLEPKKEQFHNPYQSLAVLLEGEFESNYVNRASAHDSVLAQIGFKPHGVKTKMIVVADGDIASNDMQYSTGEILPMGYDKYAKRTYANKTFLLNCLNYLLDDEGLLQLRAREVKLRLLDSKKIANHQAKWQMINIGVPLGIVIILGLIQFYIRKKKYAK